MTGFSRWFQSGVLQHRDVSKLATTDGKWFTDRKVEIRSSARAEEMDRERCVITIKGQKTGALSEPPYDACVLATGSYPFMPPVKNLSMNTPGILSTAPSGTLRT